MAPEENFMDIDSPPVVAAATDVSPALDPSNDVTLDAIEEPALRTDDPDEKLLAHLAVLDALVWEEAVSRWHIAAWSELRPRTVGPEFSCAGVNYRVLIFPNGNNQSESVSLYLEALRPEDAPANWHVCTQFALYMSNPSHPEAFVFNSSTHRFTTTESDWGFTRFVQKRELMRVSADLTHALIEDDQTVITCVARAYHDETGVLWHNFINYDSKTATGFVGFQNQGATCYMNSLLQSLYFTNAFRKAVFQVPTDEDVPTKSVPLALQRVFYSLQTKPIAVETNELTKSFGWDSLEAFMQHDVQEFNRVLQDCLENKMKTTPAEGAIERLFVGKMKSFVRCVDVEFESSRVENFYDIQLNVKGCATLEDSFKDYIQLERLDGDNKYMAEGLGLQDADKGVIFESFPPVLHLQLKRFEYDMERDAMVKINDLHKFPLEIDLEPYLSTDADRSRPWRYVLHGVLVHSGDLHSGHYYALLKPAADSPWFKFDDDRVNRVRLSEVLDANYGEMPNPQRVNLSNARALRRFTSAYMLVYVRECEIGNVLAPLTDSDIPQHLVTRFADEKAHAERVRREKEENQLSVIAKIINDEAISKFHGFDLANFTDPTHSMDIPAIRVRKEAKWTDFIEIVAKHFGLEPGKFRLWSLVNRQNSTIRLSEPFEKHDAAMDMETVTYRFFKSWREMRFYLEPAGTPDPQLDFLPIGIHGGVPSENTLIFIKYYDPQTKTLQY